MYLQAFKSVRWLETNFFNKAIWGPVSPLVFTISADEVVNVSKVLVLFLLEFTFCIGLMLLLFFTKRSKELNLKTNTHA